MVKPNTVTTLVTVPADDVNFKSALARATREELNEAMEKLKAELAKGKKVKSRIAAIERDIRSRG